MSKAGKQKKPVKQPQARFDVFVEQVNACRIRVSAANAAEAHEKGYRLWRRDWAHSHVTSVQTPEETDGTC